MKIAEQQLRHQGLKPQCTSRRIIVEMADEVLAKRRGELIAEAAEIVEQWRAEGVFGKRLAAIQNPLTERAKINNENKERSVTNRASNNE